MEESLVVMLANLLQLQNHLDPTTSPLSCASSPSSVLSASSSSAAPLLFFTVASVLSYLISSSRPPSSAAAASAPAASQEAAAAAADEYSVAAFRALSTERIWAMEAPARDAQWRAWYGLSYPVFTTVVEKLKPHIALSNLSLPSDYAVAMVLSRLAHGHSARALASRYSLDPYLVSKITNMVTRLLSTKLYPEFIKIPVGRRRLHGITHSFHDLTSLPNCCGALHSSPVPLHSSPPLLLQLVSDHKKIFWDVCVKATSSSHAAHFRDSLLYRRLTMADLVWDQLLRVGGHRLRPYVVADSSFPLLSFLLTPFSSSASASAPANAHLFDSALLKARSSVVDAIGLLKARWTILQDLNVGLNHAPQTIAACCVLHNLCQIAREPEPEPWKEPHSMMPPPPSVLDQEKSSYYEALTLRQALADHLHQRLSSSSSS